MACTTGTADSRPGGPDPLMAAHVHPGAPRAAPGEGNPVRGALRPARAGIAPPLAQGFTVRADSVPGIEAMLVSGSVVALVPGEEGGGHPGGWAQSCGTTQLA